ncbi:MAG TPA: aminopeptidase P family protein [Planctomycetes bacterium]|nr:aminopeptidase P family protein [Fuerstiella sp.]HIK94255.1 aminopeptidase P family protein [Planctomycetota bacterium]
MLTAEGCLQRRKNFWARVPTGVDWVLIGDARHVQYFSNFRINPISFSADQRCLLLLQRSGSATLLADNFVRRTAVTDPVVDDEIIIPWYTHKKSVTNRDHALLTALEECRDRWSTTSGRVEAEGVTQVVAAAVAETALPLPMNGPDQSLVSVGTLIRELRRQKLPDEIELLKRCMSACDAGHAAVFTAATAGATELDVYLAIQRASELAAGCACVVYGDFRATNAEVHKAGGLPTEYVLRDGDLFIADYSVVIHGYRSDFTNTIAVGDPTDDQLRQFEACRDALLAAESVLKAGIRASDVYDAASAVLLKRGYPALAHHCGHGLGMEHPEPPILVSESDDVLLDGDVITLEPGLYIEGVGGMRFEHNYVVRPNGAERLSNHQIGLTDA